MGGFLVLAVVPVAAGVIAGYALGGRLSTLAGRLRWLWLLWLAVAVQVGQYRWTGLRRLVEDGLGVSLVGVVFAAVFGWLAVNAVPWPPVLRWAADAIVAGAVLNGVAIAANGAMPYSPSAAAAAGLPRTDTTPKNRPADGATRLAALGDTIAIAPIHKVVSGGDTLIAAGTTVLIAAAMRRRPSTHREVNHVPT